MKKILVIFFLVIVTKMNSQEKKIELGIRIGGNYSSYTPDLKSLDNSFKIFDYEYSLGYNFGLLFNIKLNQKLSIQPELLFSKLGTKIKHPALYSTEIKESTMLLPVILKYKVLDKIHFEFGPQLGYVVSRKEYLAGKDEFQNTNTFDTLEYNEIDLQFSLGFSYEINDRICMNLRYFRNLFKRKMNFTDSQVTITNDISLSAFSLGIDYRI